MKFLDIGSATEHVIKVLSNDPTLKSLAPGIIEQGVVSDEKTAADQPPKKQYILVQTYGDATPIRFNGQPPIGSVVDLSVRVVSPTKSMGDLLPVVRAMQEALDDTEGDYEFGSVRDCRILQTTDTSEKINFTTVRYLGAIWRLEVTIPA